jgi:hypothetical protein
LPCDAAWALDADMGIAGSPLGGARFTLTIADLAG